MDRQNIFMFSGQGSQYFQMGQTLYQQKGVFRTWMDRLDATVQEVAGCSVVQALYRDGRGKTEVFDRLVLTHPAIFMVQYAMAQALIDNDIVPDLTLGASLGAFAAAAVSGHLDPDEALRSVLKQAMLFEERCQPGGMIAVIASPDLHADAFLAQRSWIASYNFSSHFVLSARRESLDEIEQFLRQQQLTFQRLPVALAFHSPAIEEAGSSYREYLQSLTYRAPHLPMVCCAQAALVHRLAPDYFWHVAREPIRFQQTIAALEAQGNFRYIDVGPAGTLATFVKYLLPRNSSSEYCQTLMASGCDLEKLREKLAGSHTFINFG